MKNTIQIFGEIGWEVTLDSVMNQIKNTDATENLKVQIHSGGGSVIEGIAIYNYLKSLDRVIEVESVGLVASIATIIWLAGTKRTINENSSFLIHQPFSWAEGTADDILKAAEELKEFENTLAEIYALETSMTKESAIEQMKLDKFVDVDFLLTNKFVTDVVEFSAVASFRKELKNKKNINKKNKKMPKTNLTKDEAKSMFARLERKINNFLNPKAKLITDANGVEIDFPDVEENSTPKVGDAAEIDGKPIEDGDVLMPSEETWVFSGGKLFEIKPKEDTSGDSENNAEMQKTIDTLTNDVKNLKVSLIAKTNELKNEKANYATALTDINEQMKNIAGAFGSDFNYQGNVDIKNKRNQEGNRSFTFEKK